MAYPLFGLLTTAVICKLAKMHKSLSLIQQYQDTATESTANGKITNSTSVAIPAVMAGFIIGSVSNRLEICIVVSINCCQIYTHNDPFNPVYFSTLRTIRISPSYTGKQESFTNQHINVNALTKKIRFLKFFNFIFLFSGTALPILYTKRTYVILV